MIYDWNIVPGTGNPVKINDLQLIWEGIHNLCIPISAGPRIIAGFQVSTNQGIGPGILVYNSTPYFLYEGTAVVNQYLYVTARGIESRNYEDNKARNVYTEYVVNASDSASDSASGVLVGQATLANLNLWKSPFIPDSSITGAQIANSTIGSINMQSNSISSNALQSNSVIQSKIANAAVTPEKLNYAAPLGTFGNRYFGVYFKGQSILSQWNTADIFSSIQVTQVPNQTCRESIIIGGDLLTNMPNIPIETVQVTMYSPVKHTLAVRPLFQTLKTTFALQVQVDFFDACPTLTSIEGTITGVLSY